MKAINHSDLDLEVPIAIEKFSLLFLLTSLMVLVRRLFVSINLLLSRYSFIFV